MSTAHHFPCLRARTSARRLLAASAAAAVLLAPAATAAAQPSAKTSGSSKLPVPPAGMSTVGGAQLGEEGVQVRLGDGAPRLPEDLSGLSWMVSDAGTGEVLAAKNAHWRLPPASTLKMLFADTLLPRFSPDTVHRVRPEELADIEEGSSLVGIKENLDYRVDDLWRGVFLRSGNDAVHVLAHMNGGIPRTVQEMQAKAEALGAADTHVVSPDGYDEPGQLSSAYDLTLFARYGLRNAQFRGYCSTRYAQFPGDVDAKTKKRQTFAIQNTDRLLTGAWGMTPYPGLIGVKNGFTTHAGNTFTGAAQRDGHTLIVTVMHPEAVHPNEVYLETGALLDWGFHALGKVTPVGTLVTSAAEAATPSASPSPAAPAAGGRSAAAPVRTANAGSSHTTWVLAGLCGAAMLASVGWAMLRNRTRRRTPFPDPLPGPPTPGSPPAPGGSTALGSTALGARRRRRRGR